MLAQAPHGAGREDALGEVAGCTACRKAALAAHCPSLHPKDTISCRAYAVCNDAKTLVLVGEKVQDGFFLGNTVCF